LYYALSSIARNIGHQVKYSNLSEEFTGPTNNKALELLSLALVITILSMYNGAHAEQFAGQEYNSPIRRASRTEIDIPAIVLCFSTGG
jgi:hypothetical protein